MLIGGSNMVDFDASRKARVGAKPLVAPTGRATQIFRERGLREKALARSAHLSMGDRSRKPS